MNMPTPRWTPTFALPGVSAAVDIFNTTTSFPNRPGRLQQGGIDRIIITIENSHAGTLVAHWSEDGGTTWYQYDSQSLGAGSSTASSGPYDYYVKPYRDWKAVFTNGGDAQTTFKVSIVGHLNNQAAAT